MTDLALAYPDITVGMASRRTSTTNTPFASRSGTPRTSVDVERKLKDKKSKGKEKEKESSSNSKAKSKAASKRESGHDGVASPSPTAQAVGNWFMLK